MLIHHSPYESDAFRVAVASLVFPQVTSVLRPTVMPTGG
jgi:hypothetical protein